MLLTPITDKVKLGFNPLSWILGLGTAWTTYPASSAFLILSVIPAEFAKYVLTGAPVKSLR